MVHRDVKPQNVLIDAEGRAKVTDFGIARSLESDGLTKTGRVLGTTDYVSPEQAMGHGVDSRSDIYSLGVLLYEMLTGEVPFHAETLVGVAMKHVNEPDARRAARAGPRSPPRSPRWSSARPPRTRRSAMRTWPRCSTTSRARSRSRSRAPGRATGEATSVLDAVPPGRKMLTTRRVSAAGIVLVLAAVTAALLIAALTGGNGQAGSERGGVRRADPCCRAPTASTPTATTRSTATRSAFAIDADPAHRVDDRDLREQSDRSRTRWASRASGW